MTNDKANLLKLPIRECGVCAKKEFDLAKLKHWQMQHLHVSDGEIEILTCEKCKTKSPLWLFENLDKVKVFVRGQVQ